MFKKFLSVIAIVALGFGVANAHQVVASSIGKNKFEAKFWAHKGFEKYDSAQLIGAKAYDKDLAAIKTGINYNYKNEKAPEILTEKAPALVVTFFDAKHWIQTDSGYVNGKKTEVEGIVFDDLKSVKIGKTYLAWNENMIKPVGLKVEVIALSNPLASKVGDLLPVLVLKDGKPFKGAEFETAKEDLEVKTNEFGIALIPIKDKGLNIIAAGTQEPLFNDPNAHKLLIQSSISFEVK